MPSICNWTLNRFKEFHPYLSHTLSYKYSRTNVCACMVRKMENSSRAYVSSAVRWVESWFSLKIIRVRDSCVGSCTQWSEIYGENAYIKCAFEQAKISSTAFCYKLTAFNAYLYYFCILCVTHNFWTSKIHLECKTRTLSWWIKRHFYESYNYLACWA